MTKPPYPIGANPPPAPPRFTHQVGRVLGAPHPDWPEDLKSFAERSAYQRGVADARELDAPHLQAIKSVLMRMRDRWWPFVHGAIGASQTARALLKESADVLNYETPAPGARYRHLHATSFIPEKTYFMSRAQWEDAARHWVRLFAKGNPGKDYRMERDAESEAWRAAAEEAAEVLRANNIELPPKLQAQYNLFTPF